MAWFEGPAGDAGEVPMRVRLARLNPDGTLDTGPVDLADDALPIYSLSLVMTSWGLALAWPERGNPDLPSNVTGASRLRLVSVDHTMSSLQGISIDITEFYSWGSRAMASLDWPRGVMLVWTGRSKEGSSSQVHGIRVDCAAY